jgi:serine protease Do
MRAGAGIAVVAALVPLALPRGTSAEPTRQEVLAAYETKLRAVAESAGPSVVGVVVSRSDAYPRAEGPPGRLGGFDPKAFLQTDPSPARAELARKLDLSDTRFALDHGCGGGVVLDAAGLVLVNYHTIEDATRIYAHLAGGKGSYADVHAADKRSDLAVLKLLTPHPGLKPIRFADVQVVDRTDGRKATVFPGKLVVMLTHPALSGFATDRPGLPVGHLSNVRTRPPAATRDDMRNQAPYSVYDFGRVLEFEVRSGPGGSGGALVNLDGELIGLTTAIAAVAGPETGPGYALAMDPNTRRIVDVLRRGEEVEYGFIGVEYGDGVTGVRIGAVTPQGPAQLAGLRPGEEIVRVDDVPIAERRDLFYAVGNALAGTKVKVRVTNFNHYRDVDVMLAKLQHTMPYVASVRPDPVFGLRVEYGSVLINKDDDVRLSGVPPGVVVRELVPGMPAAAKFKALGELAARVVITHVNGTAVTNPSEFYAAARGRPSVTLTLTDPRDPGGRTREMVLP